MSAFALTTTEYWDEVWTAVGETPRLQPEVVEHQAMMLELFARWLAPGKRFLEVGAGGSAWPGYLARHLSVDAWGIDYSPSGLLLARRAAAELQAHVHLVAGDVRDPSRLPAGTFDVVYSGGFVEHFLDSRAVLVRMRDLLAPDGVVITTVPNLRGVNGLLQRAFDRDVFDRHILHTPATLDESHLAAGLRPLLPARYCGVLDASAVNMSKVLARLPAWATRAAWIAVVRSRLGAEWLASVLRMSHGGRWFSPGLVGVYRK